MFKLAVAQYCLGEDIFDTSNRPFIGKDPGYSFEYNAFASYKKFFTRSNDPAVSVNFDLYTICGSEIAFRELVDRVRKAATPVGVSDVRYLWPISSVIADQCPALGEILGCDVEANKTRSAEKSMLECYTTAYGIDLGKFTK